MSYVLYFAIGIIVGAIVSNICYWRHTIVGTLEVDTNAEDLESWRFVVKDDIKPRMKRAVVTIHRVRDRNNPYYE